MSTFLRMMCDAIEGRDPNAPAEYAWLITADYLAGAGETPDVGASGPSNATSEQLAELTAGEGVQFRLYDDDGELYYGGRIVGEFDGPEPLDDFGTGWAGCTTVKYPTRPELDSG